MVPSNNHDISQYSWLTALTGIAKLAIILVVSLSLLFFMLIVLSEGMHHTECPEDNSVEYDDCILPE
jgi:amino acid permease